ncbi:helix-turn-helix domain-containing protein [Diaphorobacter sp. HDW4A]|uniref:IclR family transcriptional regulator n=1 Tax=Diaphorobacter sp. HDW4A TaxID=2714924 RepID=UPI00140934D9|nr:helix-turn-helix domain-containing protein [Diaphorobacter sp. HDW4A]QIL83261.1 helix-turn-helix domain-containing protein [Diaphorobacter sp. HDW4A]
MSILDNVQRVLTLFADGASELSFTEATARLDLPKSSASHLLNQMTRYGLLDQHPVTRRFRAGSLLGRAAHAAYAASAIDDACREVLEQLSSRSGLTAYLSTLSGHDTVVLQRLNGNSPVQVLSSPGSRRDATSTAMGRVLLARLSDVELNALYAGGEESSSSQLPIASQGAFSTLDQLQQCIDGIHEARHAMVIDGPIPGVGAIAAAVRNPVDGELRGLCISFVSSLKPTAAQIERWRKLVMLEVGALGRRMGDPFWRLPNHH